MKKSIVSLSLVLLISIISCKKDKAIKSEEVPLKTCTERCNYFDDLVSHHWRVVGDYEDSSAYSMSHIGLIPMSTTDPFFLDSCELDDELCFNRDGKGYTINHSKCSATDLDTIYFPNWSLIDNNTKIKFNSTFFIYNVTSTEFKFYSFSTSTITGSTPVTWIRLFSLKPY